MSVFISPGLQDDRDPAQNCHKFKHFQIEILSNFSLKCLTDFSTFSLKRYFFMFLEQKPVLSIYSQIFTVLSQFNFNSYWTTVVYYLDLQHFTVVSRSPHPENVPKLKPILPQLRSLSGFNWGWISIWAFTVVQTLVHWKKIFWKIFFCQHSKRERNCSVLP